ncbi:hypothetical protein SLE2022_338940 [Rubroshorea leprosula]
MREKSGNLLLLHKLPSSGSKTKRLIDSCSENKRLVVPEPHRMRHRRIPLGKQLLEIVNLEQIRYGLIATVLRPPGTLPPLRTHLLPFHRLHQNLLIISTRNHRQIRQHRHRKDQRDGSVHRHCCRQQDSMILLLEFFYGERKCGGRVLRELRRRRW